MSRRPSSTAPAWTRGLESALQRELRREWVRINETFFRGRLRPPELVLSDASARLGRWVHDTRTLELSRPLLVSQPWGVSIEVLKHEMAHQFVDEVLGVHDETAHGPAFREVAERLGIDAAAAGMPQAREAAGDRVIEKITRLLALAESPNQHEAEAAMVAAQRLLLKYNVDLANAAGAQGYRFRHLGEPSGRIYEPERLLATILARHFFVEAIWVSVFRPLEGKSGSVLEICGTPENLEIAAYVWDYLRTTAERLWRDHKREQGVTSDRERRAYLAGVMAGIHDKLARGERAEARTGLVWVKDADLGDYYRRRHPYVRHVRYAGERKTGAFDHGRAAGRRVELHKGVGGGRREAPPLLPPKR